jgi:hypothetical protein
MKWMKWNGHPCPAFRIAAIVAAMASMPPARGRPGRGEAAAADSARPAARGDLDLHGADLRRDTHQFAIACNADPAGPEAIGPAAPAASVLVVDLALVDDLAARRRPIGRGSRRRRVIETNTPGQRTCRPPRPRSRAGRYTPLVPIDQSAGRGFRGRQHWLVTAYRLPPMIQAGESHPAQPVGPSLALAQSLVVRPAPGRASCPPLPASAWARSSSRHATARIRQR